MAIPILNHMDFQKSAEIRNVRLHNQAASGVTSPGTGQIIYDSGTVKYYNGSAWVSLGTGSGSGTVTSVAISGTDGIDVDSGSPITASGTITLGLSNIANAKLANSSITINGSAISLGGSVTTPNTQLSQEQVEDFVGGMLDGTETGITVGYDDTNGNIDFVVADTTVAGDTGSTGITPGDTLTIAGGTNVTTAMSGDTLTITATDTNTQLSTEQVQDIVGAMFTSNTETRIAATYQDGDGTIDLVVNDMTANDNDDVSNANLLTRLAALESSGGSGDENIVIGTDSGDTIVITGNLQVSGTTTTVNSTTVSLNDHNIVLDSGNSTSAVVNGAGITLEGGSGDDATFTYSTTGPKFELKLGSSYEDLQVDQLIAASLDISGNVDVDGTLETDALTINGTAIVAQATASAVGGVELATAAEVQTGTDTARAVTPDTLAAKSVHATIDVSDSNFASNLYAEITHSLGTEDVIVQLFDSSTKESVYADIARTDKANSASTAKIKITFTAAPTNDIEVLITLLKGSTAGTVVFSYKQLKYGCT